LAVLIGVVIAFYSNRVLSFYYTVTSIIAAGLAGLFLLAFLSPRANKQGVYIGVAACLIFTTWATLTSGDEPVWPLGAYGFKLHPVMIGVLAHLVLLGTGYVASFFFPPPESSTYEMTLWGWLARSRAALREAPHTQPHNHDRVSRSVWSAWSLLPLSDANCPHAQPWNSEDANPCKSASKLDALHALRDDRSTGPNLDGPRGMGRNAS